MTDKELRRLGRQDLLQMLVAQTKEAARLQTGLEEEKERMNSLQETYERLKGKLDEKDDLIGKLKERLDEKDRILEEERTSAQENMDRLKEKLNEKDSMIGRLKERLNHKDEQIHDLEEEAKLLQTDKWKELEANGAAAEVLLRLRALFR